MNGIVKGDKTSIAAWYGGPMVDRDTFTSEELKTKVPGTDYAMSLLRHDGTGYLAGGNIHWNANGVLSGNFNSFILQGTSMVTMFYYIRLFYLHTANQDSTDFNNIDYVTPMKTFSRLSVLPLGGVEGGNNLPTGLFIGDSNTGGSFQIGNIILRTKSGDPNILEIVSASSNKTAHLGVQGGVSAYGTYKSSTGGGGGLNAAVVSYANIIAGNYNDTDLTSVPNAYSIKALYNAIQNIDVSGQLGNYLLKTDANTMYQPKGNYLTSQSLSGYLKSANAANTYSKLGHTHKYIVSIDERDKYPGQILTSTGLLLSLMNAPRLGITNNGRYYDAIIFDSWIDSSAGNTNALLFSKNSTTLYHTQTTFRSTTSWGTPIKIWDSDNLTKVSQLINDAGYITSSANISGNAATATNADKVDSYHAYQLFRDLGWWDSSETHNANDIKGNASVFAYSTHSNVPTSGVLTTFSGGNYGYNWQMIKSYNWRGLYIRQRNGDNSTWSDWVRLLDENDLTWSNISNRPTKVSQFTNDSGYITSSGSCSYATSAGNADTLDGYHATSGNNKPWGTIPVITDKGGYMDIGKDLEFHYDNSTGLDYSTALVCTGNYRNMVNLPSRNGTLALTSDIPKKLSQFTDDILSGKYLPLSGGTMTGVLKIENYLFAHRYKINNNSPTIIFDKQGNYYTGIGSCGIVNTIYFGAVNPNNMGWQTDFSQTWMFNGRICQPQGTSLYLGREDSSGWLLCQDMASQAGLGIWQIQQNTGNAIFAGTVTTGNLLSKGGVTAYSSSDIRLKQNLHKLNYLNIIKAMGGSYGFTWIKDNKHSIGWIAQHVLNNPYMSDIVETDENGYYKINYWSPKLIATAFGAIEQIDDEVSKLKARVKHLEIEVERLTNDNRKLEATNNKILISK